MPTFNQLVHRGRKSPRYKTSSPALEGDLSWDVPGRFPRLSREDRRPDLRPLMPRKGIIERREVSADPIYANPLVEKLINCVMERGKKAVAQRIVYDAFEMIKSRVNDDPLKVFKKAVENVRPSLEVKTRRVGGANYQVPVEVNRNRQTSLGLRWLIGYARDRGEKSMVERLAG